MEHILSDVIGMCFDTTASNTGSAEGACILFEKFIGRNLLYFAHCHHIYELIIVGVLTSLFGPSNGTNIRIFARFEAFWPHVKKKNFKALNYSRLNSKFAQKLKTDVILFLQNILKRNSAEILDII